MSPHPPLNERSHQTSSSTSSSPAAPYSAARRSVYSASAQSTRQTMYSSLGDALGGSGMHAPQQQQHSGSGAEYSVSSGSTPSQHQHVPPDERVHYTPSGLPSYGYSYQPGSYTEPISQYGHSSLPPMRTASPAAYTALSQPITQYNAHGTPYPPSYSQGPYVLSDKEWVQSPQGFNTEAVQPMFVAGRSDVSASPQVDQRSYVQPQYSSPGNIHPEERSSLGELSPSSKGKTRDQNIGRPYRSPSSSFGSTARDYNKVDNFFFFFCDYF